MKGSTHFFQAICHFSLPGLLDFFLDQNLLAVHKWQPNIRVPTDFPFFLLFRADLQ
jgi:hypothetical protein